MPPSPETARGRRRHGLERPEIVSSSYDVKHHLTSARHDVTSLATTMATDRAVVDGPFSDSHPQVRYRVQVLDRTFRIMDALAAVPSELGPAELAARLGLHKSTIHRLLVVLERQRYIRKTSKGKYSLGMKLFELGSRAVAQLELGEHAAPFLRRLVDETGETTHICVLSGTEMMSVANVEGQWTLRTTSTVGRRTKTHCTAVGKALIAFLPERELSELIARLPLTRHTHRTIITPAALRTELAHVRRRGFAVDDEEIEEGLRCIGSPIRNYTGEVIASLSIAGPVFRIRKSRVPELARAVMAVAEALSADLGYHEELSERRVR
jgi:DNA-binding IclR family transcriptional regulator